MKQINPYNFVSLKHGGADRENEYPGLNVYPKEKYLSGVLECYLKPLTPLISILHGKDGHQPSGNNTAIAFNFLKNSNGLPIIQSTSIKGMMRSIYEAITNSCLTLVAPSGQSKKNKNDIRQYSYQLDEKYLNSQCKAISFLCPACSLFGTIGEENFHCKGRIWFSDAQLLAGSLKTGSFIIKQLNSPKPHHHATYGKSKKPGGALAGRKFYYHHKKPKNFKVTPGPRTFAINEYATPECLFQFRTHLDIISEKEFSDFLLALELVEGLGHKIGLGKAIGLGSCQISIDREKSAIYRPSDRYSSLVNDKVSDWYLLKAGRNRLSDDLIEVLRLNKETNNKIIEYPPNHNNYPKVAINALGEFSEEITEGGKPDWATEVAVESPEEPPPVVKNDEEAAWLKEIYEKKLLFITAQGEERERPRHAFQGKNALLILRNWFILKGSNCVKPVK
ncbi:MAG: hypothetical protein KKC76_14085 [Proteobacteria bacterium]|nr:hypothetical protein [Pseudomonadota bacterium]MBU4298311.1 hypothetical protein [Pseudomonadota bacterium]MCG2749697.1 RAMP superfamily CRISPR-associated protein [Desulfobulbaceae bacterium]